MFGICNAQFCRVVLASIVFWTLIFGSAHAAGQNDGVYIIYDSSNSMWATLPDSNRKYLAARDAMRALVSRDFGNRQVALRMYGHRRKNDCSDSELVIPFSQPGDVAGQMIAAMENARPTGRTPIDYSLRQALSDFGDRKGTIILISDGIESCDADPCALVRAWREKDVAITVHVVGLGLKGKEKKAMQCIADAAQTQYRDAYSTGELIDGLDAALDSVAEGEKPVAGEPNPNPQDAGPDFALVVETPDGVRQLGVGVLTSASGDTTPVRSFERYTPVPGSYTLSAGVRTIDGNAYKPVSVDVAIADAGRTVGRVVAPLPPEASATFAMEGESLRSTVVTVFQDGKKLGSFKGDETVFVPEGTLEFRSKLAGTSKPLSVTETFAQGEAKTISFDAATEVHLQIIARGTGNGVQLRGKPTTELWQNNKRAHKINNSSGGLVTPGTYTVRIDDRLNLFETEIVVSREPRQVLEIDVPAGGLTVLYHDLAGNELKPKRVFVAPAGKKRGQVRPSNKPMILMPGTYTLTGWPKTLGFPEVEFVSEAGKAQTVILRATKNPE